ncbi:MAG: hypothetical protein JXA57_15765 [Armatimonadetes bacterium]|nr:hypothetical protein [Armatimonadota bacterium]
MQTQRSPAIAVSGQGETVRGKEEAVTLPEFEEGYETDFEFPLWVLIKERAEQKDICYYAAAREVVPEYMKTIRYDDEEFENAVMDKAIEEVEEEMKVFKALMAPPEKGESR